MIFFFITVSAFVGFTIHINTSLPKVLTEEVIRVGDFYSIESNVLAVLILCVKVESVFICAFAFFEPLAPTTGVIKFIGFSHDLSLLTT
jgi:hypothetical protein